MYIHARNQNFVYFQEQLEIEPDNLLKAVHSCSKTTVCVPLMYQHNQDSIPLSAHLLILSLHFLLHSLSYLLITSQC